MQPSHNTIEGGWKEAITGWAVSGYGWLFADMPGIAQCVAVATLVLTLLKIADAVRAWRASDKDKGVRARFRSTFGTKPTPLDMDD